MNQEITQETRSLTQALRGDSKIQGNWGEMHLEAILEKAGLIKRKKTGRTHWIEADLELLAEVEGWFAELKSIWELRLNKLDEMLNNGDQHHD